VFEYLDRKRFDIGLYALEAARNDLERYCANRVDRLQILPRNPLEQVAALRNENLDILFFGSNLTAGVDACTTLALHRLAPIQIASICCPVTTGFTHMDYYLAGDLLAPSQAMQTQFREELLNIAGSGICFSFGPEPTGATKRMSREALGIPADAVMFISGANYFKIIPELREAWANIISRVPGAVLVLYPFNPNWSGRYNTEPFVTDIKQRFAQRGLAEHQLRILDPLPGRPDIKALLRLADVYLDSYPYGGATSLIDTLEAGLPPVVVEGDTLRFRQAPSMLRELSVPQLIADSEHAYIELACRLGNDATLRQQVRQDIQQNMKKRPAFLDSRGFGQKVAQLFQSLYERTFP
jgi:predicted O-linked N-acetylglucosamine transferase (SPINDLY family)